MAMVKAQFDRLVTGIKWFDTWLDTLLARIEARTNITASPPLKAFAGPGGVHLSMVSDNIRMAKSGGSGIPAATLTTMGKATVTVYDIDPATGDYTSQTITDDGYNLSTTAVGNNKMLLQVKVNNLWITFWEQC